jgi:hypothetical protein
MWGRNGRTVAQQRLGLITCKFCFAREGLLVSTKLPCKSAGSAVASVRRGVEWEFCKPGPRLSMQPTSALERRSSTRPSPSLCHRCLFDASGVAGPKIAGPCSFVDERLFPRGLVCVEGGQELHHCTKIYLRLCSRNVLRNQLASKQNLSAMKALDLPGPLHTLVAKAFTAARQSESLLFSSTELAIIHTRQGVPVSTRPRHRTPCATEVRSLSSSSNCDTAQPWPRSQSHLQRSPQMARRTESRIHSTTLRPTCLSLLCPRRTRLII